MKEKRPIPSLPSLPTENDPPAEPAPQWDPKRLREREKEKEIERNLNRIYKKNKRRRGR